MRKSILGLALSLFTAIAFGQDPHFSQFFASPLSLNPAFTGKFNGNMRLAANHRDQWPSIPKAYVTTSASVDFGILRSKIPEGDVFGIGLSGVADASANNQLKLNYGGVSLSYHKALDADGYNTIGAGFQGVLSSMTLDFTKLYFEDMLRQNGFTGTTAETFNSGNRKNYYDVNAGVLYSGSTNGENNYYLGVSMYHINRPKVNFKDHNWYLGARYTIHAGGNLPINDVLEVSTSGIYQWQGKASETVVGAAIGLNANRNFDNPAMVYLGSWMRIGDAVIPYLGLEYGSLKLGITYDVNINSLKAATNSRGGSEFSIIYTHKKAEHNNIPCPKF